MKNCARFPAFTRAKAAVAGLLALCVLLLPAVAEATDRKAKKGKKGKKGQAATTSAYVPQCLVPPPGGGSHDPYRQPFFGVTHLHTGMSFDAGIRFVPSTPADAYAFAKGEDPLPGVKIEGDEVKIDQALYPALERPIDWGAVTDHSEHFGEVGLCKWSGSGDPPPGYNSFECQLLRGFYYQPADPQAGTGVGAGAPPGLQSALASAAFSVLVWPNLVTSSRMARLPLCENGATDCTLSEESVWQEMQTAARDAYEPCIFTSFVGYEVAASPGGTNWHRNVIFRNDSVVDKPVTTIDMGVLDTPTDPNTTPPKWLGRQAPENLWQKLKEGCQDQNNGCDVLTIPHNSNVGGGIYADYSDLEGSELVPPLFENTDDPVFAQMRQDWEPLVEIYQDKGSSECRWDPRHANPAYSSPDGTGDPAAGVLTTDEHCAFELLDSNSILSASGVGSVAGVNAAPPLEQFPPRSWVRNVLKDGLMYQDTLGVNPFKLGIVSSSDSHNGTMGFNPEDETFRGHLGIEDYFPTEASSTIQNSSGGHSVVWAEENSRDAIFDALKRRETYGTSGTRPIVRFFGNWDFDGTIDTAVCDPENIAMIGYDGDGVPMGGDLPTRDGSKKPKFLVGAWFDDHVDGGGTQLGTTLQQIQIIKGWYDGTSTQEKVYLVAGDPNNGATVDDSCGKQNDNSFEHLCEIWEDPDFEATQNFPTFYYVRVLENPVCRYSTHICQKEFGINPLTYINDNVAGTMTDAQYTQCQAALAGKPPQAAYCCSNQASAPIVQPVIQERAWTSPIWYTPGT